MESEENFIKLHITEVEVQVLGALMMDNNAWERVASALNVDLFFLETHRKIFSAMSLLKERGMSIEPIPLTDYLVKSNLMEAIGGYTVLAKIGDSVISAINIDLHVKMLKDYEFRRKVFGITNNAKNDILNPTIKVETALKLLRDRLDKVNISEPTSLVECGDAIASLYSQVEFWQQHGRGNQVPTGFYDVDNLLSFQPGNLVILAARPSMGKTALALNFMRNIAKENHVLFYSLEMTVTEIAARMVSIESKVPASKIVSGKMSEDEINKFTYGIGAASELSYTLCDSTSLTLTKIREDIQRVRLSHTDLKCVFIDYLQLLNEDNGGNRVQEVSKITRGLKQLAIEFQIFIVALSQLNRGVESRNNKRPMLSDLRDSGSIEQDADIVGMLYREDYYDPETEEKNVVELNITKHRNGRLGMVKLLFDRDVSEFKNMAKDSNQEFGF